MSFASKVTNYSNVAFERSDVKRGKFIIRSCLIYISMSFASKVPNHIEVIVLSSDVKNGTSIIGTSISLFKSLQEPTGMRITIRNCQSIMRNFNIYMYFKAVFAPKH